MLKGGRMSNCLKSEWYSVVIFSNFQFSLRSGLAMELTTDFAMRHEKTQYGYTFLIALFVDITLVYE